MQLVIFLTKGLLQAPLHPVPSAASGLPGQSGMDQWQQSPFHCPGTLECWLEGGLHRSGGTAGWQAVESARGQQVRKELLPSPVFWFPAAPGKQAWERRGLCRSSQESLYVPLLARSLALVVDAEWLIYG